VREAASGWLFALVVPALIVGGFLSIGAWGLALVAVYPLLLVRSPQAVAARVTIRGGGRFFTRALASSPSRPKSWAKPAIGFGDFYAASPRFSSIRQSTEIAEGDWCDTP